MTPGLNPHCALVRRLGQPAYESCKSCELRLQNCIQFRGQLYGTAIVTGVLATAFVPLPLAARAALAAVLVGVVFHFLRYVARESHLSIVTVSAGDDVVAGQAIGLSGGEPGTPGAGNTTGPHLHLGIRAYGQPVCPQPLLLAILRGTPIPPTAAPTSVG